jgi:hypothetical protein
MMLQISKREIEREGIPKDRSNQEVKFDKKKEFLQVDPVG